MSEQPDSIQPAPQAVPEGSWVLTAETFMVPVSQFPGSDLDRQTHAEAQQILTLIYAMVACGMDFYVIKARILGIEE